MEKVSFGKVVKLHGIKGQLKISTKLDDDYDLSLIKTIYDKDDKEFLIEKIFKVSDGVVVKLEGVEFDKAKNFVNEWFYVNRELFEGKILIEDLKDSDVCFENDEQIGKIFDVQDFGSAEVIFVLDKNGREFMFPNVKGVIASFDYKNKKLVINKQKLNEVCEYED